MQNCQNLPTVAWPLNFNQPTVNSWSLTWQWGRPNISYCSV